MTDILIKFKLEVPKTKDLIPPHLETTVTLTIDADPDLERVMIDYFKKSYEKKLTAKLKEQLTYYKKPLASMQKDIDKLRSDYNKATSAKTFDELLKQINNAKPLQEALKKEIEGYASLLQQMVDNTAKQQVLAFHTTFEKEAKAAAIKQIGKDIFWKKVRHVCGIVVKGTLILAAGAAAVALSVATLGTAPAIIGGIGLAFASISALKSVYDVGKKIRDTVKMQEASIEKLSKDLADIATHLGKSGDKTKGLSKHLDDASRFHTQRRAFIDDANDKVKELDEKIREINTGMSKLSKLEKTPKAIAQNEKALKQLAKDRTATMKAIRDTMQLDERLNKEFEKARKLIGALNKIEPTGPRTMSDTLKQFKNLDNAKELARQLGVIAGGAKAVGI